MGIRQRILPGKAGVMLSGTAYLSWLWGCRYVFAMLRESVIPDTVTLQLRTQAVTRDRRPRSRHLALQSVPLHQAIERRAIDARAPRRFRQIAAGMRNDARQELPVELGEQPVARVVVARVRRRQLGRVAALFGLRRDTKERQVLGLDFGRRLEQHDGVLDDVLELAHVPRPRMRAQRAHRALAEARHGQIDAAVLPPIVAQERIGEQLDV